MANYHVTNPSGSNEWKVVKAGAARASAKAPTQSMAEYLAKGFARESGGGEVRIHRPNGGPIRDSDTVSPARDPYPPKDKQH